MKNILVFFLVGLSIFRVSAQQGTTPKTYQSDSAIKLSGDYKASVQQQSGDDQISFLRRSDDAKMEMERVVRDRENDYRGEVFRTGSAIFTLMIVMVFVVIMVRAFMDNRLRHKILQNNVQPDSLHALLDLTPQDRKVTNLRWVFILAGAGIGLLMVAPLPLGIASVAIMCLSLAASFLAFHFFVLRKTEKGS